MYFYCYVYVFLLLCMFCCVYSVSLCCSTYFLCVNVYSTTATACQPNGKQVYQISASPPVSSFVLTLNVTEQIVFATQVLRIDGM